jgi:prepilin-type N-terminal cleavage/methylation domain-containing protein
MPKKGFTIVEIVIVVAVLAIAGLVAWRVWDMMHQKAPTPVQQSEEINSKQDLDRAVKTLDETNIDGDESAQLEGELSF